MFADKGAAGSDAWLLGEHDACARVNCCWLGAEYAYSLSY